MEVLVHGTKQGYKSSFMPNQQSSFALGDIRKGVNNEAPLGKSLYSLAFIKGGCVFSKYTIVRDTLRAYATGNIAFSLFLHANRELSGKGGDVKSLLDKLTDYYLDKYVRDYNINRGETILIQEDWNFIQSFLMQFNEQEKSRIEEEISSGTTDPAFHYYQSETELIELFDNPYQEEYSDYKQIFFIDSNLKGAGNPLNVLKNSGVEVNPDLNNEYYYLNNYNNSKGVQIIANGKPRSDIRGSNQIRAKWQVEIKFSKDDRCYYPIKEHGTIFDLSNKFIEIRGNQIIIKYDALNNPKKKEKIVTFQIKDRKGLTIQDAIITCKNKNNQIEKRVVNNQVVFEGDELKESWSVLVGYRDSLGRKEFIPLDTNEIVELTLEERKTITINVKDEEGGNITDFEVSTKLTNGFNKSNTIEFVDEQINDFYDVKIRKKGFEDATLPMFIPHQQQNNVIVSLKRKPESPQNNQKYFAAKAKKFLSKRDNVASSVAILLVLIVGVWALIQNFGKEKPATANQLTNEQITAYVKGDSLMVDKLNDYKKNWASQKSDFENPRGGILSGLFGRREEEDKVETIWFPINESIESAISKRQSIDNKKFADLKVLQYSEEQLSFKEAIAKIDSTKYTDVGEKLGDVSTLTLTQIANSISSILNPEAQEEEEEEEEEQEEEVSIEKNNETNATATDQPANVSTSINNKIIEYIKGSELKEEQLDQYKATPGLNPNLIKSIQLCKEYWALNGQGTGTNSKTYCAFLSKVNADSNLQNSKLKATVAKKCQDEANSYSRQDKIKGLEE